MLQKHLYVFSNGSALTKQSPRQPLMTCCNLGIFYAANCMLYLNTCISATSFHISATCLSNRHVS